MTDHKKNALRRVEGLHDYQSEEGMSDASMLTVAIEAQVEATLHLAEQQAAIAEQQRIGNLIALAQGGHGGSMGIENIALDALRIQHVSNDLAWGVQIVELRPEIRTALGLGA